jgi:ABC-type uncharacterized transport system auxiliary subunit
VIGRVVVLAIAAACSGRLPETRYYQIAAPAADRSRAPDATIVLESLTTDPDYEDDRIVYRINAVRVDYYHYHRWSAPPGVIVARALARGLERGGRLRVAGAPVGDAVLALDGRITAIEEVDITAERWVGRVALELRATELRTGDVVWSAAFDESAPLTVRSPEGLARALGVAIARIAARAAPELADLAVACRRDTTPAARATVHGKELP